MAMTLSKGIAVQLDVAAALPYSFAKYLQDLQVEYDYKTMNYLVGIKDVFGSSCHFAVPTHYFETCSDRTKLLMDSFKTLCFDQPPLQADSNVECNKTLMLVGGPKNGTLVDYSGQIYVTGVEYNVPLFPFDASETVPQTTEALLESYREEFLCINWIKIRIYLHGSVPQDQLIDFFKMCLDEFPEGLLVPHYRSVWRFL